MTRATTDPAHAVQRYVLTSPSGLTIEVMDQGATWLSCRVPLQGGQQREVLLGCDTAEDYARQTAYLGAIVGRYANRIADARFSLDGRVHQLTPNEGPHQLHGGPQGFSRRRWTVEAASGQHLSMSLRSPDGDQGFPGEVRVLVVYSVGDDASVEIRFEATTTQPCPVNLTSHAYFNLDGADRRTDCRDHRLFLAADLYQPVREDLIPDGPALPVAGTAFDFRERDPDREPAPDLRRQAYDHSYVLRTEAANGLSPAARLTPADGRLAMSLTTDMPALQFYSGGLLAATPARGGGTYAAHTGLALEPQVPPDSPNRDPEACVLRPEQTYRHFIRYRFDA